MKKPSISIKNSVLYITIFAIVAIGSSISVAKTKNKGHKINYYQTITDYIALPEPIDTELMLINQETDKESKVTVQHYIFNSQIWPKQGVKTEQKVWQHRVDLYIPQKIDHKTALLWINGGTQNYTKDDKQQFFPDYPLNFKKIANKSNSLVIDLKDIPNQYITLDGKQYAEDGIIAHTWAKFIEDPEQNRYLPAYLPMVKSVIKTMDRIVADERFSISDFVLAGLSKRGMTTWLTSLHDERVKAIIPVSIDVLNFDANIKHIHNSLQEWPIALHDYYEQNVLQQLQHKNSEYLLQINDPFKYITCKDCRTHQKKIFQTRAKIDKYIIVASGDDFFTPDASLFYLDSLPGNNYIRTIPNSRHYINNDIITDAVLNYFYGFNNKLSMPEFKTTVLKDMISKDGYKINIVTDKKPKKVTLYAAQNLSKRDFRLAYGTSYQEINIKIDSYNKFLFEKTGQLHYKIAVNKPAKGWQASFVEFEYEQPNKDLPGLKLTTPVEILPKQYPKVAKLKDAIQKKAKQLVQYGKKVIYN